MSLEYATVIGYGLVSLILILVGVTFETQERRHMPIRLLIILIGIFVALKIPSTLNTMVYANDANNMGIYNSTLVEAMIRSNSTISSSVIWIPFLLLVWVFIYYYFVKMPEDVSEMGSEAMKNFRTSGDNWNNGMKNWKGGK